MINTIENNKRIARNTLLLYVRMLLLIVVQLYSLPIVLNTLGIENYGIYNVVGGIVTMFSFIGGSLASGSQRFLAFEIGRRDKEELKKVFDTTVTVYIILAFIAFVLIEVGGYWFLNFHMNIPKDRMYAANWVFQLSVFSFLVNLISIPYNAAVIAHERMSVFAYISILECMLRLAVAIFLQCIIFVHLITYAILICFVTILIRIIYQFYCIRNFEECRKYQFTWTSNKGKELLAYSGWNMIGAVALISRQQGLNIVINIFFGPLLNAAHSIGQQINGVLVQFINNIYTATRPQITKLYANNEIDAMWKLVFHSSKLALYLLMILSIPLMLELDMILKIWLQNVPPNTAIIGRLMILSILIETLTNQIIGACQAANRIKRYQIHSSTIILLNVPISYMLLFFYPTNPILPYCVSVALSIFYVVSILWNAHKELKMDVSKYIKSILIKVIIVYGLTFIIVLFFVTFFSPSFFRIVYTCCITILSSIFTIWVIGLDNSEKKIISRIIIQKFIKK